MVVLDTCCRLSSAGKASEHLDAISSERDVHLFRMSDAPLYRYHRDGAEIRCADSGACRAMVRSAQRDDMDGEGIAVRLIEQITGLTWDDLFDAEYTAFDMD